MLMYFGGDGDACELVEEEQVQEQNYGWGVCSALLFMSFHKIHAQNWLRTLAGSRVCY